MSLVELEQHLRSATESVPSNIPPIPGFAAERLARARKNVQTSHRSKKLFEEARIKPAEAKLKELEEKLAAKKAAIAAAVDKGANALVDDGVEVSGDDKQQTKRAHELAVLERACELADAKLKRVNKELEDYYDSLYSADLRERVSVGIDAYSEHVVEEVLQEVADTARPYRLAIQKLMGVERNLNNQVEGKTNPDRRLQLLRDRVREEVGATSRTIVSYDHNQTVREAMLFRDLVET